MPCCFLSDLPVLDLNVVLALLHLEGIRQGVLTYGRAIVGLVSNRLVELLNAEIELFVAREDWGESPAGSHRPRPRRALGRGVLLLLGTRFSTDLEKAAVVADQLKNLSSFMWM